MVQQAQQHKYLSRDMPDHEYLVKRQTQGIDWAKMFVERPELAPPGYQETVQALYSKEEPHDEK